MFDINTISKRYFNIKLDGLVLDVEPPKIKVLRKIVSLTKDKSEETMDNLTEAVRMILNKNKSGYHVPDEVVDELDFDQLMEILTAYFTWMNGVKNSPN